MDTGAILNSLIGAVVPVVSATAFITYKLSAVVTRLGSVERQVERLDANRETVALIPFVITRLEKLEAAVFRRSDQQ